MSRILKSREEQRNSKVGTAVGELNCKGSIPILPFRYAIMPKVEGDHTQYYYDSCPSTLDKGFDKLETAAYSIRTLRPGYIYLYDEDLGITFLWEADGRGNYVSLQWTSLEDYGETSNKGRSMPNITVDDKSHNVFITYSPDLWSKKGLANNIKNKEKFMVKLNIQEILNGSKTNSTQQHVLSSDKPEHWIEEYKTSKSDYEDQFGWSSYKPDSARSIDSLKSKAKDYAEMHQPKLPVFMVLYDNIGTAIDLGNIAAQHMHQLSDIKNLQKGSQTIDNPVPVEMKLDTADLKSLSIEFHRKKVLADLIESILKANYPSAEKLKEQGSSLGSLEHSTRLSKETLKYSQGRKPRYVGDAEARIHALQNSHVNPSASRVLEHLNIKELMAFRRECDLEEIHMRVIVDKVLKATNDHKTVLLTMETGQETHPRNLASTLFTYDRKNIFSATALEQAIAFSIQGMGIPVPGKAEIDTRFKLLEKWVEDEKSPLFTGVKAFSTFQEKVDSLADTIDGIGNIATELHELFPYALGTNIIVNEITPYTFKKLSGETRWNKSDSVIRSVNKALEGTNLKKLFEAFQGRYAMVSEGIQSSEVTKEYMKIINTSVGDHATRSFEIQGTRTTTITDKITTTSTKINSVSKVVKVLHNSGLPAGIAWLHTINLYRASQSFSRDDSWGNSLNLGSAVFGFAGVMNEVAIMTTKTAAMQKIIGKQAQNSTVRVLSSSAAKKFLGYGGAGMEFAANFYDAWDSNAKGDTDAALWAGTAAITLGAGGALITAALTGVAVSASVPVAGWFVAGTLLIIAGIGATYMKIMSEDWPLEVWVSRTFFGIHRKTLVFGRLTDILFKNLSEELIGYYNVTFSPVKLDDAKGILSDNAETYWDEDGINSDQAKFTFLLPGYIEGISSYKTTIDGYDNINVKDDADRLNGTLSESDRTVFKEKPVLKEEGLYVYVKSYFDEFETDSASLRIEYYPQGKGREPVVKYLYVDD